MSASLAWNRDMTGGHHRSDQSDQLGQLRRYRHIDPVVPLTVIDDDRALSCALSRTVLEDAPAVFALLERALQEHASAAIAQHGHALGSMCSLPGARQWSSRLQAIERAAPACAGTTLAAPFVSVPGEVRASIADREAAAGRIKAGAVLT
jgi:hypothetical protein